MKQNKKAPKTLDITGYCSLVDTGARGMTDCALAILYLRLLPLSQGWGLHGQECGDVLLSVPPGVASFQMAKAN